MTKVGQSDAYNDIMSECSQWSIAHPNTSYSRDVKVNIPKSPAWSGKYVPGTQVYTHMGLF